MILRNKIIKTLYYLLTLGVIGFALYFYKTILSYLLISLLFAFLVNPLVVMIENLGIKRGFAILIFYIIFFANIVLLGNILLPTVSQQLTSLSRAYIEFIEQTGDENTHIPYFSKIQTVIDDVDALFPFVDFEDIGERVREWSNDFLANIPNLLLSYTSNVFKLFTYFLSVPVLGFFLLKDHIALRNKIYSMIPNKYFEIVLIILDKINSTIGKYLRAIVIQETIIGTLACIVLSVLGVRFGILIGILVGIFNVIPYVGPLVGIVLGCLTVILTGGSTTLLIWTGLGLYGVQVLDNTLVYPLVMGKNTNLHPVIIILTVIAGGASFGLLGMLLAVPTVFLTITLLKVLYTNLKQFEII